MNSYICLVGTSAYCGFYQSLDMIAFCVVEKTLFIVWKEYGNRDGKSNNNK